MTIYDYTKYRGTRPAIYAWTDRKGNILKVPDASWDPVLDDDKGDLLREYLLAESYDGPGDWNPL